MSFFNPSTTENVITNHFDELSDLQGRKEMQSDMLFEVIKNSLMNPIPTTSPKAVIVQIDGKEPQVGAAAPAPSPAGGGASTHPWVLRARIRILPDSFGAKGMFTDEICKVKNDKNKLIQALTIGSEIAYSEACDGDENVFIPTVGDVVPVYYDIQGPGSEGKRRGPRFKLQRLKRAEGGFDAACIEALGGPPGGQITLSTLGTVGGVLGPGVGGPGGFSTAGGLVSGAGVGSRPGTISAASKAHWPSGIIGVEQGEPTTSPDPKIFNYALARMDWWMNKKNNPLWPQVPHGRNNAEKYTVKKPHLLTIVDTTLSKNTKNTWTYDLRTGRTPKTAGLLVYTWGGVGRGSFVEGPAYRKGGKTSGGALDWNNGANSTSPGMKVLGGKRTFKRKSPPPKGSSARRALKIMGLEPWNSREDGRGAIAHETAAHRTRSTSFGCLSTHGNIWKQPGAKSVHFHAWEVWTGGSWLYVWTGHKDESVVPNIYWAKSSPAWDFNWGKNPKPEFRRTWDWTAQYGGHSVPSPRK